jgi:hypothetical protein
MTALPRWLPEHRPYGTLTRDLHALLAASPMTAGVAATLLGTTPQRVATTLARMVEAGTVVRGEGRPAVYRVLA